MVLRLRSFFTAWTRRKCFGDSLDEEARFRLEGGCLVPRSTRRSGAIRSRFSAMSSGMSNWPAVARFERGGVRDQQNRHEGMSNWPAVARFERGPEVTNPGAGPPAPGQAPDAGASNTAVTSTANPASSREVAVSPGANTPCSTYRFSSRVSTVTVALRGSTIQYSGMPASA